MASNVTSEKLQKLREDRLAREQARIQKLRELNLKKYGQSALPIPVAANATRPQKSKFTASKSSNPANSFNAKPVKNEKSMNPKPSIAPLPKQNNGMNRNTITQTKDTLLGRQTSHTCLSKPKQFVNSQINNTKNNGTYKTANNLKLRKTLSMPTRPAPPNQARQSLIPKSSTVRNANESVFERLYKPKVVQKTTIDDAQKLRNDPEYLKKVISASNLITNRRQTCFETKKPTQPIRRSISAVHLKKISKSELKNCIKKWASIGENVDKESLEDIDEGKEEKVVSAIKSERKKVKFQTPLHNAQEMLSKLTEWLHLHGRSIDCYPHLKCFGIPHDDINVMFDDENKENIALEHDSDNESFTELNCKDMGKWRSPSCVGSDFNESFQTPMSSDVSPRENELLLGALNHLTELLKSGYNWEECARWLRAIRERYDKAADTAAYWECRGALEERRGDLPASMQCWERALAKGAESSVAEASLDQLLDKFMQLKINPASAKKRVDAKFVDAKNVFRSTLIRFAIQEAKNNTPDLPKVTVTPVRRSTRLSSYQKKTPLKLFNSIQQAIELENAEFRPNRAIAGTP